LTPGRLTPKACSGTRYISAECEGDTHCLAYPLKRTYPDVEGPILGKHDKGVVMCNLLAPENSSTKSKYNVDEVSLAILFAHTFG